MLEIKKPDRWLVHTLFWDVSTLKVGKLVGLIVSMVLTTVNDYRLLFSGSTNINGLTCKERTATAKQIGYILRRSGLCEELTREHETVAMA